MFQGYKINCRLYKYMRHKVKLLKIDLEILVLQTPDYFCPQGPHQVPCVNGLEFATTSSANNLITS